MDKKIENLNLSESTGMVYVLVLVITFSVFALLQGSPDNANNQMVKSNRKDRTIPIEVTKTDTQSSNYNFQSSTVKAVQLTKSPLLKIAERANGLIVGVANFLDVENVLGKPDEIVPDTNGIGIDWYYGSRFFTHVLVRFERGIVVETYYKSGAW